MKYKNIPTPSKRSRIEKNLDLEAAIARLWKKSPARRGEFKRSKWRTKELSGLYSDLKKEVNEI